MASTPGPGAGSGTPWWVVTSYNKSGIQVGAVVQTKRDLQSAFESGQLRPEITAAFGPYTSQKAAQAAARKASGPHVLTGWRALAAIWGIAALNAEDLYRTGHVASPKSVATATNAASTGFGLAEIAHWIGKLVTTLTDAHMWISIGWLLLGLGLVFFGGRALLRHEGILSEGGGATPVPVPL